MQLTRRTFSQSLYPDGIANSKSLLSVFATAVPGSAAFTSTGNTGVEADVTMSNVEAMGVHFKFEAGGEVARISIVNLVMALTTGIVLTQAVGLFVQVQCESALSMISIATRAHCLPLMCLLSFWTGPSHYVTPFITCFQFFCHVEDYRVHTRVVTP